MQKKHVNCVLRRSFKRADMNNTWIVETGEIQYSNCTCLRHSTDRWFGISRALGTKKGFALTRLENWIFFYIVHILYAGNLNRHHCSKSKVPSQGKELLRKSSWLQWFFLALICKSMYSKRAFVRERSFLTLTLRNFLKCPLCGSWLTQASVFPPLNVSSVSAIILWRGIIGQAFLQKLRTKHYARRVHVERIC